MLSPEELGAYIQSMMPPRNPPQNPPQIPPQVPPQVPNPNNQLGPPIMRIPPQQIQQMPPIVPQYVSLTRHFFDVDDDDDDDEEKGQNIFKFLPNTIYSTPSFLYLKPFEKTIENPFVLIHNAFQVQIVQNGLKIICSRPLNISNFSPFFPTFKDFCLCIPIHDSLDSYGLNDMTLKAVDVRFNYSLLRMKTTKKTTMGFNDDFSRIITIPLSVSHTHNYICIRFINGFYDIPAGLFMFVEIPNLISEEELEKYKPKTKQARKEKEEKDDEKKDEKKDKKEEKKKDKDDDDDDEEEKH